MVSESGTVAAEPNTEAVLGELEQVKKQPGPDLPAIIADIEAEGDGQ